MAITKKSAAAAAKSLQSCPTLCERVTRTLLLSLLLSLDQSSSIYIFFSQISPETLVTLLILAPIYPVNTFFWATILAQILNASFPVCSHGFGASCLNPPCCCCCCQVASVVSDPVRPHTRQPTRLPRPWDSPGKNTGVGCHVLLQCMKVKSESEVAQSCPTLSDPMDSSPSGSSIHGNSQA